MIFFDTTKSSASTQSSGLVRVNSRLLQELGSEARPVSWKNWDRKASATDRYLTTEIFSPEERPGFREFLRDRPCPCEAVFHDAIPLKFPHIVWPQAVARHPGHMKLLASFDRVWAVSEASRGDLLGYWRWLGIEKPPPVNVLSLGADFDGSERGDAVPPAAPLALLCVGILEPRKNQTFLLGVCEELWAEGLDFELHLVGRVNSHFGKPVLAAIKALRRKRSGLVYHGAVTDPEMARLYSAARACVFPTTAEGCGLPVMESLWKGVPCVCSDLPALRESADGGGCLVAAPNDREAWRSALRDILTDDTMHNRLASEAAARRLPTWADAARAIAGARL